MREIRSEGGREGDGIFTPVVTSASFPAVSHLHLSSYDENQNRCRKPGRLLLLPLPLTPSIPDTKGQIPSYSLNKQLFYTSPLLPHSLLLTWISVTTSLPSTILPISNPFTTLLEGTSNNLTFQIKIIYGLVICSKKSKLAVWLCKILPDLTHLQSPFQSSIHLLNTRLWRVEYMPGTECVRHSHVPCPPFLCFSQAGCLQLPQHATSSQTLLTCCYCYLISPFSLLLILLFVLFYTSKLSLDAVSPKNHSLTPYAGWVTDIFL